MSDKIAFGAFPGGALSGPVLRDTARLSQRYAPIARCGVVVSQHGHWVRYPLPLFSAFPAWRACEVEVQYPPPPPSKGVSQRYSRDTLWKQAKWVRYPPLRYYVERVLRDWGGISHWATKVVLSGMLLWNPAPQLQDRQLNEEGKRNHGTWELNWNLGIAVYP